MYRLFAVCALLSLFGSLAAAEPADGASRVFTVESSLTAQQPHSGRQTGVGTVRFPKVTLAGGKTATVKDVVQRPFVTSGEIVDGRVQNPHIEVVECGLTLHLTVTPLNERLVKLEATIVASDIDDVKAVEVAEELHFQAVRTTSNVVKIIQVTPLGKSVTVQASKGRSRQNEFVFTVTESTGQVSAP